MPEVLALRYDWRETSLVTLHNFGSGRQKVKLTVGTSDGGLLVDVFNGRESRAQNDGAHRLDLGPHGWRWLRVGGADNALDRSDLDLTNPMRGET